MPRGLHIEQLLKQALENLFTVVVPRPELEQRFKVDLILDGIPGSQIDSNFFPAALQITTWPRFHEKRLRALLAAKEKQWARFFYVEIECSDFGQAEANDLAAAIYRALLVEQPRMRFFLLVYFGLNDWKVLSLRNAVQQYLDWQPPFNQLFEGAIVAWGDGGIVETKLLGPDGQVGTFSFSAAKEDCEPNLVEQLARIAFKNRDVRGQKLLPSQQPSVCFTFKGRTWSGRKSAEEIRLVPRTDLEPNHTKPIFFRRRRN